MRTSILSRSVVAVATLAIGSVALAATPATAATATGVTRDQVLTAANGVRTADANDTSYSAATRKAIRGIIIRTCAVDTDASDEIDYSVAPTAAGGSADGVLISAYIYHYDGQQSTNRTCAFAAVATTDASRTLSGAITVTAVTEVSSPPSEFSAAATTTPSTTALSGDVYVTPTVNLTGNTYLQDASFTASGAAVKTIKTTTTTKVKDKKTKSEKKAAKSKYTKRLDAAKKKYDKALDKAGSSKSKKAAAKKAYSAKKKAAKTAYKKAIANFKLVKKTTSRVDSAPFGVNAAFNWND